MNRHEDEREEQLNQPLYRSWSRSSRGKFIYSHEKVDRVDIRSLDRVWERLEEHISRNSAAYENNKNLPTFQQTITEPLIKRGTPALTSHRQQAFQQRFATLVAVLLVTLLIGSLVLVLQVAQHTKTTTGAHGTIQATASLPSKGTIHGKQTVSITVKNGVSRFTATKLTISVGSAIIWHNQTGIEQVVLTEGKNQTITIASHASTAVFFKQAQVCVWHLQSNPEAQIAIVVGNVSPKAVVDPQCDFQATNPSG